MTTATIPTLTTERLTLRPLRPDDVDALHATLGRADVMRHYVDLADHSAGWSKTRVAEFLDDDAASWARHGLGRWGVEAPADTLIGCCGLSLEDWLPVPAPPVGLSFRLHPAFWGLGLAGEAARAVLDHAFEALGLCEVVGCAVAENTRSRRVLEKLAMQRGETVPYTSAESGRSADFIVYRRTKAG